MATWEAVTKDGRSVKNGGEPTGRWRVRYRDSTYGSPKSIPAETETEAIETAGLVEAWHKLNPGVPYPRETRGRVVPTPLGDVAVKWLRDLRNTAPTTVALYSRNIETFAKRASVILSAKGGTGAMTRWGLAVPAVAARRCERSGKKECGSTLVLVSRQKVDQRPTTR